MSCKPKDYEQQWNRNEEEAARNREKGLRERMSVIFFAITFMLIVTIGKDYFPGWNSRDETGREWKQMYGNDGRLWRGVPDNNAYAGTEGAELRSYYQYSYDGEGRLSEKKTFHRHSRYREDPASYGDVWALSNVETLEYDGEGRLSRRNETSGDTRTVYEYTEAGCTERNSWSYAEDGKITRYDPAGNKVYFRNADNYRFPHVTTWEYDRKNRPVRKTLEVEGPEPYGAPAHVTWAAEYDGESHTSVETEYGDDGEITCVWHCVYDEDWNKVESFWYVPEKLPEGYEPEECEAYYTKGYWALFQDGCLWEKMENRPWKENRNDSEYTARDYDGRGNLVMELKVYSVGYVYLYRYVYDGRNRLKEQFDYNFDEVRFWEHRMLDGSRLTLQVSEDGTLSVTRTGADGALLNRFVYGENEVETQQTPEGIVRWQLEPSLLLAEKGSKPGQPGQEEPDQHPGQPDQPGQEGPDRPEPAGPGEILYIVEEGDCLWRIAEEFLGDGRRFQEIYRRNRDVIGDDPGRILPGMGLYMEGP